MEAGLCSIPRGPCPPFCRAPPFPAPISHCLSGLSPFVHSPAPRSRGKLNSEIVSTHRAPPECPGHPTPRSAVCLNAHSCWRRDTIILNILPPILQREKLRPRALQSQGLDPEGFQSQPCLFLTTPWSGTPSPLLSVAPCPQSQRPHGPGALGASGPQLLPVCPRAGCNQDPPKPPGP